MLGLALRDTGLTITDLATLARAADDAGYSSIWAPEVGSRDALLLATLYGSQTRRAAVGTGVLPVYARNVVALALGVATAAEASGGRFILGLGAGHRFPAEAWFGATWNSPRALLRETVEVLRRILRGERVSHDGRIHVEGFHLATTPPHVPVYLAALTPGSLRLGGEIADGVILNWLPTEGMERSALLVREAAADAERRVQVIGYLRVAIAEGPDQEREAWTAMRDHTYSYVSLPAYANALRKTGLGHQLDRLNDGHDRALDPLVEALCACGTPETVRDRLDEFQKAGLDTVVIYPVPYGDDPAASILRTLRAIPA
jgi:alkanesulfonate monooxygenase SsuD/methylene tetrahydromethanopterin reductase-like flavin-dependent oxidoreductase (luciferase family)